MSKLTESQQQALTEYKQMKDLLLLQKRLGHKKLQSTMRFLDKNGGHS
jgi:hypothetical protein